MANPLDTRQGYSTGPQPTAEEAAAYNQRREAIIASAQAAMPTNIRRATAEREARAEAAWRDIDHRAELRRAHAELAPLREDVARLRHAYERAQTRLVELGDAMRYHAVAYDRQLTEAGQAAAEAYLDGLDDRSAPPRADPNGADLAAQLAVAEIAERTLADQLRQAERKLQQAEAAVAAAAENAFVLMTAELADRYRARLDELGAMRAQLLGMQKLTKPRLVEPGAPWHAPKSLPFLASTRGAAYREVPASDAAIGAAEAEARELLERLRIDPEAEV
jgi:hypothetical protein